MRLLFTLLSLHFLLVSSPIFAKEKSEATYPPIHIVTEGALQTWLMPQPYLPIFAIQLAFKKSGSAFSPQGKEGLVMLLSDMLDEGSKSFPGALFKEECEAHAITLHFFADEDHFYVMIKALKEEWPRALTLLKEALTAPSFESAILERVKQQHIIHYHQQFQDAPAFANIAWRRHFFGTHPYGNNPLGYPEAIQRLTSHDLHDYLKAHLTTSNVVMSIVGDVTVTEAQSLLKELATYLPTQDNIKPLEPPLIQVTQQEEHITKPFPQSAIVFGMPAVVRKHPDFYPLYLLNHMVGGGGFESRLMKEIREKKGLTYAVFSEMMTLAEIGMIKGMLTTDALTTQSAMSELKRVLSEVYEHGVTAQELEAAKRHIIFSLPLKLDKNEHMAAFLLKLQLEGLEPEFLSKRQEYINAVTLADIRRVAAMYLDPQKLILTVVGK